MWIEQMEGYELGQDSFDRCTAAQPTILGVQQPFVAEFIQSQNI